MTSCPKCSHVRQVSDPPPHNQCPNCGVFYDKVKPQPAYVVSDELPVRPRQSSSILFLAVALAVCAGSLWYLWTKSQAARDAPVLVAPEGRMSIIPRKPSQGIPAYSVSMQGQQVVARLLPAARLEMVHITNGRVALFTTSWCPYCVQAKQLLDAAGVPYAELDIEQNADALRFHARLLRAQGVPVIVDDDRVFFGFDEAALRTISPEKPRK